MPIMDNVKDTAAATRIIILTVVIVIVLLGVGYVVVTQLNASIAGGLPSGVVTAFNNTFTGISNALTLFAVVVLALIIALVLKAFDVFS